MVGSLMVLSLGVQQLRFSGFPLRGAGFSGQGYPKAGGKSPEWGAGAGFPRAWVFLLTLVRLGVMERAPVNVSRIRLGFLVSPFPLLWLCFLVGCSDFWAQESWNLPAEAASALPELFPGTGLKPCGSNNIFQRN